MPTGLFKGAKLKVERANCHIRDLNNEIVGYIKSNPYRLVVEENTDTGGYNLTMRVKEKIPCSWPSIIGDVIHNLRSALDLMIFEIVSPHTNNTDKIQFPFCSGVNGLEDTITNRQINFAGDKVVNIVRSLKPYPGGNDLLYAIHDLDIMDKHKGIIVASTIMGIPNFTLIDDNGAVKAGFYNCRVGPVEDGRVAMSLPVIQNLKIGQDFKPTFEVIFHEGLFRRKPVLPSLSEMAEFVNKTIGVFESELSK